MVAFVLSSKLLFANSSKLSFALFSKLSQIYTLQALLCSLLLSKLKQTKMKE